MDPQADISAARGLLARAPGWSLAGPVTVGVVVVLLFAYWETVVSIVTIWMRSGTYAHGFLIPLITGYLIWRSRGVLVAMAPRTQWLGLIVLGLLSVGWLAGEVAEVLFVRQMAVAAMIPVVIWILLGPRVVGALAFPLAYLVVFAVPWGQSLVPTLQDFTAAFSVTMLQFTGIPVYWEGRLISIPSGDFQVAEACSGIRYVIASLALGSLFAYISYRSNWKRVAFIAAALLVPVLANGLRAYGIIMLAHLTDHRLATGVDHILYGWVFFGVVMLVLFWLGSFWAEASEAPDRPGRISVSPGGSSPAGLAGAAGLAIALAWAGPVAAHWAKEHRAEANTKVVFPVAAPGWIGPLNPPSVWDPGFQGADTTRHRLYRRSGQDSVHLLVIHYRRERQGAELVNNQNRLFGEEWRRLRGGTYQVGEAGPHVRELVLTKGGDRRLVWSWYDIGGRVAVRPLVAKAYGALNRLQGGSGDASLVAVAAGFPLRPEQARERLRAFLAAHPALIEPRGAVRVGE
jgi:exosortase A